VTACKQYEPDENMEEMPILSAFLSHASLESGESQADDYEEAVQLMTLHSAKGLEFPLVFMVGVEEGMFPSQQSADAPERLEEERRLAYVGMTRARQRLFITYAEVRRMYGQEHRHRPSRFIAEIPEECLYHVKLTTSVSQPAYRSSSSSYGSSTGYGSGSSYSSQPKAATNHVKFTGTGFSLGQRVMHAKFGEGTVLNCEGDGEHARIQVNFDQFGAKWLVTTYAKLTAV